MVIPVVSLKGGVGKSTITLNVADLLNIKYGSKVLILDTDPQNSISYLLCQPVKKGLSEVLLENIEIKNVINRVFENKSLYFISNGYKAIDDFNKYEENFTHEKIKNILETLEEEFDFIFIDTPPQISNITFNILKNVDLFFLIVTPEPACIASLKIFFKFLKGNNINKHFYIIVNKIEPNEISEDFHKYILSLAYGKTAGSIPRDRVVLESEGNCTTVLRYDENSAFVHFLDEVIEKIEENYAKANN